MDAISGLAEQVLDLARAQDVKLALAESCTGGLVSAALTEIAGSSSVVDRGFVTYSNDAKSELLGVPMILIETHGAVSEDVARAMAEGALARSHAQLAVSITGVAGPGGGSDAKPVGLVWFALAGAGRTTQTLEQRFGDVGRRKVRSLSVETALTLFKRALE
ncbi:MAG: nicotinamide-nucleotide amidohydrolase family protein [Oceanicaulis sp.]